MTVIGRRSASPRARGAAIGLAAAALGAGRVRDRLQDALAVAKRQVKLFEVVFIQLANDIQSIEFSRNAASCRSRPSP
jgi:hypothetical protein